MVRKNSYLIIITFLFLSFNQINAQWRLGVQGGLNLAKYTVTHLDNSSKISSKIGITIGTELHYIINEQFEILSGIRYDQKGGKITHSFPTFSGNATVYYNYVEVPFQIIYIPFDIETRPILFTGLDLGYIVTDKAEGIINNQKIVEDYLQYIDNRFDVYFDGGVGIMPNITNNIYYSITVSYYYGLYDLTELISANGVHFLLGVTFRL